MASSDSSDPTTDTNAAQDATNASRSTAVDTASADNVQDRVNRERRPFESKPEQGVHAGQLMVVPTHSRLTGPILDLNDAEQGLLFAELSSASYLDEPSCRATVEPIGFDEVTFFDRDGAQAYRLENHTDIVLACRGTEPTDINDVKADADAAFAVIETVGRVHRGFNTEVDDLWPRLKDTLGATDKNVWFCGHSLGGAMATISAGRCYHDALPIEPSGLFTYGSPRVGDKQYINWCTFEHKRFVNNNDIVPRLPPRLFGFRHHGEDIYINRKGRIHWKPLKIGKFTDRLRGFWESLLKLRIDQLHDHNLDGYITALAAEVNTAKK